MNDEFPRKMKYNLFPGKLIFGFFSFIGSVLTIYLALPLFKSIHIIFTIIALLFILLIIFTVHIFLKLRKVIKIYNNLVNKYIFANDNRNTLDKLMNEKNKEIEELKSTNYQMQAQRNLLYFILLQDEKPNPLIVKQALKIEEKGLNENEE